MAPRILIFDSLLSPFLHLRWNEMKLKELRQQEGAHMIAQRASRLAMRAEQALAEETPGLKAPDRIETLVSIRSFFTRF